MRQITVIQMQKTESEIVTYSGFLFRFPQLQEKLIGFFQT